MWPEIMFQKPWCISNLEGKNSNSLFVMNIIIVWVSNLSKYSPKEALSIRTPNSMPESLAKAHRKYRKKVMYKE
jgi:hypothetical protein